MNGGFYYSYYKTKQLRGNFYFVKQSFWVASVIRRLQYNDEVSVVNQS